MLRARRIRPGTMRIYRSWRFWLRGAALVAVVLVAAFAAFLSYEYLIRDEPEAFFGRSAEPDDPVQQLKYGSTGGDRLAGIPIGIFKALPDLCRDHLPGGWSSLGFIYEEGRERPVGSSRRRTLGFERVSLNCGACHVGTYRAASTDRPVVVPGMPANKLDLSRFARFLTDCALDERFNPWEVVQAAERAGERYSWFQRLLLRYVAVPALKEGLIFARHRFRFLNDEPEAGPGRFDTFNPAKALLNWRFEKLPSRERIGIVDFPSLWLQGPRDGMHLHWDGNNDSVEERNRSAAFGTGAVPTNIDRRSTKFIATWLRSDANRPPKYFERVEQIDQPVAERGKALYTRYCAECHGASGDDFTGAHVGQVEDINEIRTDPCRLDNYTYELAAEQGNLYAGYPAERFRHFRKTNGYANLPLDGLWLRAPYLHNGSVPTLRDLLEPWENRPKAFYRGYDVIDRKKLGFISEVATDGSAQFFRYETQCTGDPSACKHEQNPENRHDDNVCVPSKWAGNSNRGHDGERYGTHLSAHDKDAIVEFLKTF
jgi:hypothetical protein